VAVGAVSDPSRYAMVHCVSQPVPLIINNDKEAATGLRCI